MMSAGIETEIATLLREAEAAHGTYEANILGGQLDDDWAGWYASHLLDRGIGQLVPALGKMGNVALAAKLKQFDADFRSEQPPTDWPEFYARRLMAART